jgi:hypothetical protein
LDVRTLVKTEDDLTSQNSWGDTHPPYKGMIVVVQSTGDLYTLIDKNKIHSLDGWKKISGSEGTYSGPTIMICTQTEYDNLTPKDNTLYYIQEDGD